MIFVNYQTMSFYDMQTKYYELIVTMNGGTETWRKVKDYDNYSVSTFGRVRNDDTNRILKHIFSSNGYCLVNLFKNGKAKQFYIHRLVLIAFRTNPKNKKCVDHKDHNRTNNNIHNLRWATTQENSMNKRKSKNNTSGYIGVAFIKKTQKFRAFIEVNGKQKHLGLFVTIEDAKRARKKATKLYYGEFANNN